jgi:hypothetical protein
MIQNKFGEMIFTQDDVCNLVMSGQSLDSINNMLVDTSVKLENLALILDNIPVFIPYNDTAEHDLTQEQYDQR